jgi:hypothetical protein
MGGAVIVSAQHGLRVEIATVRGETATAVAARIAASINNSDAFRKESIFASLSNSSVSFNSPRIYACSNTERRLGVPPRPLIRHCRWNKQERLLEFAWTNPAPYHSIVVVDADDIRLNRSSLQGTGTRYMHPLNRMGETTYKGPNVFGVVGMTENGIGCKAICEVTF